MAESRRGGQVSYIFKNLQLSYGPKPGIIFAAPYKRNTLMWTPQPWMQPLQPACGVKVTHRIHVKVWQIETAEGVIVVTLNWQTGEMVAAIQERPEE